MNLVHEMNVKCATPCHCFLVAEHTYMGSPRLNMPGAGLISLATGSVQPPGTE